MIKLSFPIPRLIVPEDTFCGPGSSAVLRQLPATRALVLSGKSVKPALVEPLLQQIPAEVVHHAVKREPGCAPEHVQRILASLEGFSPDWIVAIGGGAVMDTAKLLLLFLQYPDIRLDKIRTPFSMPPIKNHTRLALIPTTAGSGSEVSSAAAYKDPVSGATHILTSHDLMPSMAILDPLFLGDVRKDIMASSILDAITHAVESYISVVKNPLAKVFSEKALGLIHQTAIPYFKNPHDKDLISRLQMAAYFAGIAQNHCGVGACHSLAHQMTRYDLPHGTANSLFLEAVLNFNTQNDGVRQDLQELLTNSGTTSLSDLQMEIKQAGGLPRKLSELSLRVEVDKIAEGAMSDVCTRFNPRAMEKKDFQRLFQEANA